MIPLSDVATLAARFERFGALDQARQLYREALELHPDDAELWSRVGRICRAMGHHDEALDSFRRAAQLRPLHPEFHNDLGSALMRQGRLDEAIDSYRTALRLRPEYPEATNNLGNALTALGDLESAAVCYRQAIASKPDYSTAYCNLGNTLVALGERGEAVVCYRQAVQLGPEFAQAWLSLGRALRGIGRSEEAIACYEQAAHLQANDPDLLGELGILLMQCGDLGNAVDRYEQALCLRPDSGEAYNNLGLALLGQGRVAEARLSFEQALYLRPDLPEIQNNLGLALLNEGRAQEARLSFEQALALRPEMSDARNNLGLALEATGKPDDALACFEQVIRDDPHHLGALTNLGNAYKDRGRAGDAIAAYRRVLALCPDNATVHSNLLLAMQYQPGVDTDVILREARAYGRQHADSLAASGEPHRVSTSAGRRLRIGYVSPDFREHPIAYFLEPILSAHDHRHFEICCYADVPKPDDITRRLEAYADHWRALVGVSDAQAAEVIRREGIDILVDLAGHTGGNRLPMFARKPAPIQVSYLGYLGTTGVPAMDYYITDAHADPAEFTDAHYSEKLIRLPECAFCYRPGPAPEVSSELPARKCGHVNFGCLNNPAKVSDELVAVWSRVLASVPGSRLLLRTAVGGDSEERMHSILTRGGISPRRLFFAGPAATRFGYLELYHTIDIGLDPFPYNGVTTTCDALWMGVPVISLAGQMSVARQGVRFLRNVGLDELLAETPEDYIRIASDLAGDFTRLAALRSGLRERMSRSPVVDGHRLTFDLEAAYRAMWETLPAPRDPIKT